MGQNRELLIAASAATGLGNLGFWLLPLTVGNFIDGYGYSEARAGLLSSLEVSAIALASLAAAPLVKKVSLRRMARVFAVIAIIGHALSAFAPSFPLLAAARFTAGLGEGAVLAAGYAAIAASANPDRAYATVFVIVGIGAAALLSLLPNIVGGLGPASFFLCLAALTAMFLPLTGRLPHRGAATADTATENATPGKSSVGLSRTLCLLAAIFFVAFVESCAWTFIEQRGQDIDFTTETIGYILGGVTIVGVLGGVLAALLGTRYGRLRPILLALLVQGCCIAGVYTLESRVVFTTGLVFWSFCLFFVYPFLLGASASADQSGRLAAAAGGLLTAGGVLAPGFSGTIVGASGYAAFAIVLSIITATAIALLLLSFSLQHTSRS
jgi:predicted MFS family arabinose efflux permease